MEELAAAQSRAQRSEARAEAAEEAAAAMINAESPDGPTGSMDGLPHQLRLDLAARASMVLGKVLGAGGLTAEERVTLSTQLGEMLQLLLPRNGSAGPGKA